MMARWYVEDFKGLILQKNNKPLLFSHAHVILNLYDLSVFSVKAKRSFMQLFEMMTIHSDQIQPKKHHRSGLYN